MVINRFCKVLHLSFARTPCLYVLNMSGVHLILDQDMLFVFFVLLFGHLFESSYFLLFDFFSVKNLLFLFYPHSMRSCMLESSTQPVLNHGLRFRLFISESYFSVADWCHLQNGALQNARLLC